MLVSLGSCWYPCLYSLRGRTSKSTLNFLSGSEFCCLIACSALKESACSCVIALFCIKRFRISLDVWDFAESMPNISNTVNALFIIGIMSNIFLVQGKNNHNVHRFSVLLVRKIKVSI